MARHAGRVRRALCALVLTSLTSGTCLAKGVDVSVLRAFQSWADAVRTHTPGRADAAVVSVAGWSFETRRHMDAGMEFFLTVLLSKRYDTGNNEVLRLLADVARLARGNPDAHAFLQRAVILHSDTAMYGDRDATSVDESRRPPSRIKIDPRSGIPIDVNDDARIHPLLSRKALKLDKDGQILGDVAASWNWPFARWLVDYLLQENQVFGPCHGADCAGVAAPAASPFIGSWYHATIAYMFANGLYGEATTHVQRAGEVLSNDARILFDRGCYSEILGLPMHQVLLESDAERGLNQAEWLGRRAVASRGTSGIPRAAVTNAEAERLFRDALRVDPSYVEARVRLARLLEVRKRHEEAGAELEAGLAANPTAVVAFLAHLFAGRSAQSLGRFDDAAQHFADASALYPEAQSARLAASQIALLRSDVAAALALVDHLGAASADFDADPWWDYHLAAGRDAHALLVEIWANVAR